MTKKFKIYPGEFKGRHHRKYIQVYIFDDPGTVKQLAKLCAVAFYKSEYKYKNRIGKLVFCKLNLDIGICTHELAHAAMDYCKRLLHKNPGNRRHEELLAYSMERLARSFWEWLG